MDEKKLAELHAWLQTKGAKNLPEVDVFISKANADNGKKLHDILYNAGATKLDYDSFSNEYKSATPAPELKSANPFDLMREAVSEKPVAEKVPQKEGIVGSLMNKTYNEAVQKQTPAGYSEWKSQLPKNLQNEVDYDLQQLYRDNPNAKPSASLHLDSKYKKPNHITFSDESIHSNDKTQGGRWEEIDGKWNYTPSEYVLSQHPEEELKDYFKRNEPDAILNLPKITDYYNQAKPQPHAELVDGEPQNVLGLLSPDKKKIKDVRPKTGDFDINAQPIFKDNVPSTYQNALSFERPQDAMGDFFSDGREESDPIKAGIQKYAELKKSESPIKQLDAIVEATRPKIDPNNPLQVHTARYQKAINRDKSAIENIVNTTINPISQTEEGGIMDYILPKSELSQLNSAAEALTLSKSAEAIQQRLDKGEILSRTQSEALKIAQKRAGSPDASPKELARIMQAIEENDDKTLLNYVAPLDREFAKTAYNDIDKDRTAAAYKKRPNELTSKERLGFWFGTTKYNQQREDKDDPAYLPYTMLAHDDQNISQQIERLKTLFPDQKEGAMSLEPPKGLAAQFPNPAERTYAYYQILANRYTQLTKELQNESISMDREDKANLLDERLKANSLLQGAAMFLPIVGVQDVTNPKVKEWYSVLNKINALAPMIRNAKVGAAENEAQDYTLGRFTNAAAEAALDIYGAPYEKTDRARIAGEQSEVINDAEINPKTGMNPESIAILKERSKSGDIDDLATWGNAAGGFAGIMMPFMAAGMAGGNKLQSATQGLSRLDKGSQIGRVLLNTEGGLTKTGWLAQKAINLGMTGLQYEYAGAISGEGKDLRNELRFSQGVLGYAGSQALTGSLGLLMKGGMKLGGKFVSKIPYFEKGIKAIEEAYGSKYANYAKAYLANGFSELGEEIPQDWRNNLEEVKGDDTFQKMIAAAQRTAADIAYDYDNDEYSLSKTLGYALPIIAMGGKYDGIGVEDVHKISDWAVTFGEQITGEKTSEEDRQTIREFSDFIADQAGQSPANVRFTDKGTLFTLDGKEYLYDAETQSVTSKQGVTEPEKQNAVAVAQEMMANYNKAIKEGDFTGLFGENVRPYNKQNEETPIPQPQEVPAQEIVQETPEIAEQEAPIVESAEAIQEAPEVEAAEIEQPPQKTAEELDSRRAEISTTLSSNIERANELRAEIETINKSLDPLSDDHDEMIDLLSEKENELSIIQGESESLAAEDNDIAEQRKVVRTEKEAFDDRVAEIDNKIAENTGNIEALKAQYQEAATIDDKKAISAEMKALRGENKALGKEKEGMQPKKETPTIQENRIVETPIAETPIIAETPQLETPTNKPTLEKGDKYTDHKGVERVWGVDLEADKAHEIVKAFEQMGKGAEIAGIMRVIDQLTKGKEVVYKNPLAIKAAQDNQYYNVEIQKDGSAKVIGVLNPENNEWIGVAKTGKANTPNSQTIETPTTESDIDAKIAAVEAEKKEYLKKHADQRPESLARNAIPFDKRIEALKLEKAEAKELAPLITERERISQRIKELEGKKEGKGFKEFLKDTKLSPASKKVVEFILNAFPKIAANVTFLSDQESWDNNVGDDSYRGFYATTDSGKIIILLNPKNYTDETVIHELIHAFTQAILDKPSNATEKAYVAKIQGLFDAFKQIKGTESTHSYIFNDVAEFITYAMTNTDFQDFLNSNEKTKTLFQKVVAAIKQLFGIPDDDTVSQVIRATQNLIDKTDYSNIKDRIAENEAANKGNKDDISNKKELDELKKKLADIDAKISDIKNKYAKLKTTPQVSESVTSTPKVESKKKRTRIYAKGSGGRKIARRWRC